MRRVIAELNTGRYPYIVMLPKSSIPFFETYLFFKRGLKRGWHSSAVATTIYYGLTENDVRWFVEFCAKHKIVMKVYKQEREVIQ